MLSFEHANYSLKSDSININKKGVVLLIKNMPLVFVPNDEEVDFIIKNNFSSQLEVAEAMRSPREAFGDSDAKKLSNLIDKSNNIVSLWDQIGVNSWDYWIKNLLDVNSKIIVTIQHKEGDSLIAKVEDVKTSLASLIQTSWEQNFLIDKIIYDTYLEVTNTNLMEFFEIFKVCNPDHLYKIGKLYLDKLPEDLKNQVLANCL